MSLNIVSLTGRVGFDPEVRYFEKGIVKAAANLAVDEYSSGERKTHWIPVEFWGKTAETVAHYVHRGKLIGVQGSLKADTWTDNQGKLHKRLYVRAERVELLSSPNGDSSIETEAKFPKTELVDAKF